MSQMLVIRPSDVLKFDECPKQYYFEKIEGFKPLVISANLPFGTAVHDASTGYILSTLSGRPFNPVDAFMAKWEEQLEQQAVEFSSVWDEESMAAMGRLMVERFPAYWDTLGLMPLIDEDGPVVERRFKVQVSKDIVLSGQPDILAVDTEANVYCPDLKTSAQSYDPLFALSSEQLTAYDILVGAHRASLGIPGLDQLGYLVGVKRKVPTTTGKGPTWEPPLKGPSRSPERKQEYLLKLKDMASSVQQGNFPRRPRMAYNSPCTLCDFKGLCLQGSMTGLHKPDRKTSREAESSDSTLAA